MSIIYTDAVNGSDSNAGTSGAPVKTLTKAATLLTDDLNKLWLVPSGDYTDCLNVGHHVSVNVESTVGPIKAVIKAASPNLFGVGCRNSAVLTLTRVWVKPGVTGQHCCNVGQNVCFDLVNCDLGESGVSAGALIYAEDYAKVLFAGSDNNVRGGGQSFVVLNNACLNLSAWVIMPTVGLTFTNGFYNGTVNSIFRLQGTIHGGPGGNVNTYASPYMLSHGSKLFLPAAYSIPGTGHQAPVVDGYSYAV